MVTKTKWTNEKQSVKNPSFQQKLKSSSYIIFIYKKISVKKTNQDQKGENAHSKINPQDYIHFISLAA